MKKFRVYYSSIPYMFTHFPTDEVIEANTPEEAKLKCAEMHKPCNIGIVVDISDLPNDNLK